MSKTAIIYWSATGNTEAMAAAIAEGAKEVNPDTAYFTVSEISADAAAGYDTLILGCPAMGAEVLEEAEFEPFFSPSLNRKFQVKTLLFSALTAGVTANGCAIGKSALQAPVQSWSAAKVLL